MPPPNTIPLTLNSIAGRSQGSYPATNPDNSWRIAAPFRLSRVDTIRQVTHLPESGAYAFWRWASTKHANAKRVAWQGGHPPFRFSVFLDGERVQETVWVRTQSAVNPAMYDHTYPTYGYEHTFQPDISKNGTTLNYTYLIESQDGQALVIAAPTQVDNSRFKYFAPLASGGNNGNAGTFEAPLETFGYGYASVANGHTFIYCYKSGTYNVNNGTPMNDAAFDSTHCRSHVGIESGVVMNVSTGHFSQGTSDIYVANFTVTGGRTDRSNVRQFDLNANCTRFHAHKIIGDVSFIGTLGNDNPASFMFWNLGGTAYHENMAFTDCTLSSTSLAQFATLFRCKNVICENFKSVNATPSAPNGGQHFHFKDGCLNVTVRHCEISGTSTDGMLNVGSQSWELCGNVDVHFCKIVNLESGGEAVSRWNSQVHSPPFQKPQDYYIQRCDVDAFQASPFTFENYEETGYPVNYTAIRWESTSSTFNNAVDAGGGVSFGTTTVKVADINTYSADDLGVRGYKISSTLVV